MNYRIRRLFAAGLGAAVMLCVPARVAFAASAEVAAVEQTPEAAPAENVDEAQELEAASVQTAAAKAVQAPVNAPVLTVQAVGCESVTVTWEAVDGAVKYALQQSVDGKTYVTAATRKAGQELRYVAEDLYAAQNYYYRVIAKNADGAKAVSEPLQVMPVLSKPVVKSIAASAYDRVSLEWEAVDGADFYRVYRSTTKTGGYQRVKTLHTTSYTNKVTTGVTYFYKIMPVHYNPDGAKVRGKCSAPRSITAKVAAPVISSVRNASGNALSISWDSVAGADGYAVYRSESENADFEQVAEISSALTNWSDEQVKSGVQYYYKVGAFKTVKGIKYPGDLSKAKAAWTLAGAPDNVAAAQDGNGSVTLTWNPVASATSYHVYRAEGTSGKYTKLASKLTSCSYTDSGLAMEGTYSYQVQAVHGTQTGEMSQAVTVQIGTIRVNTRTLFLGPGATGALSASSELPGTISWRSADPSIASVDSNGTVVGVAQGKTKVFAVLDTVEVGVDVTVTDCQLNGIDVSKWQQAIDWKTVKDSGIKFAMLRLAHGTSNDNQFENYYAGAKEQGIPVGIYCYTLAKSVDEGIEEAEYLLELLDGKELDYPIALDLESENQIKNMNKAARTKLILEYKRIVEEAGYQFVVYSNLNWLNNYIDQSKLAEENVDIWIARYCSQSLGHRYEGGGNVRMWQYSSTGQVDGILDAYGRYINVDLDVCYDGY